MDLKRLKTFVRVARTLNVSEAARQIHRTQPSITEQIQALISSSFPIVHDTPCRHRVSCGAARTGNGKRRYRKICVLHPISARM